jgi:hypothetical protein
MREVLVILIAIAILAALTAIKYRRQIVTLIQFYKQLQAVRQGIKGSGDRAIHEAPRGGIELVKCERCNKWIPQSAAMFVGGRPICREACRVAA